MPPAADRIDLDSLLRDALSSVAVAAFSRRMGISAHIDNHLPGSVLGDARALGDYLRRGLARTAEAGQAERIALALWLDDAASGGGEARILLEACRAVREGERPPTGLADIWALPIGGGIAQPIAARQSDGAETVLIPLPCTPDPDAPLMVGKWGGAFRGRYILHARDVLFDRERLRNSLAAVGLEAAFATSPQEALELAQARAGKGRQVDFLVLDSHRLDAATIALVREFRTDPRLAGARIVLVGDARGLEMSGDETALFDAVLRVSIPWRRLLDLLHDLIRERAQVPEPQQAAGRTAGDIPDLAGRRILIAEDVATNQMLLRAVLAPTGAEIKVVTDGAAVLERHGEAPADLTLMDLQMPGMGGIAAMRRLRALGGAPGAVPVVALTAYAGSADRQLALDAGMDAYLAKPIVVAEFYDLLNRLLPEDGA
ncbi:MAG: response regulator [Alphaproteobacteria bacterium]